MLTARSLTARVVTVTALGLGAPLVALAAPAAAAESGTVYVVHGVPGLTVDVYVNDDKTLTSFAPGSVAGPLTLDEGDYDIAIRAAGDPATATPAIDETVTLPAGANVSLVAHLSADGKPTLTPFVNPLDDLDSAQARLVVRHTAAAPAVDILAGGQPVFTDLTNPNADQADLAPGTVAASVALAGTTDPVIGPADLTLAAGKVAVVYAIGSATDKTLDLVVQSLNAVTGGGGVPAGAAAGTAGLVDERGKELAFALAAAGLLIFGTSVVAVRAHG